MLDLTTLPPVIDTATAAELLRARPDVALIDVRTPAEFRTAHIPGSRNIPLDDIAHRARELARTLDRPALIVCRTSARAYLAKEVLRGAGVKGLHVLDGGVVAWAAQGRPLAREHG